jgi:hypothetical protein
MIRMSIEPASISFRGSNTAVPIICYSDSQGIGSYSTEVGYTNYQWSSPNGTPTAATSQTTNMNWPTAVGGSTIPISVSYDKTWLGCNNKSFARNGVIMRNPTIASGNPVNTVGQTVLFTPTNIDGYEYSWSFSPSALGRFTDQQGNTAPPSTTGATYITWDRNNEPDLSNPIISVNYWIYYPQVGGSRISYCSGATTQRDIRACGTCSSRQAADDLPVDDAIVEGAFVAYPTPANDELWVHNVPLGASIKLISTNGAESVTIIQDEPSLKKKIETAKLGAGVYVIRTLDIDNQPVTMRIVVVH